MLVKEAIAKLKSDIHTLETNLHNVTKGDFLIRKSHLEARKLILKTYETVEPESEIIVADFDLLITLN